MPADVVAFTGRAAALAQLDADTWTGDATAATVVAVTGMAGVGKTALAVRWSHRNRHHFPDGQLYVNLHGYSLRTPVRPIEALAGFLHALGVAPEKVPSDPDQATGMYRTLMAGRRMLVLLDNAGGPEQIRPLLPGSPGCHVLLTSRDRLSGMVAVDGVRRVDLDVLAPHESRALLSRVLPGELPTTEAAAVGRLAAACAHLPLALRIAAASIADAQGGVGGYLARLHDNRLDTLGIEGDPQAAVRVAFDLSYATLTPHERRLFRLLGLAPVRTVTALSAADLAGAEPAVTGRTLARLASAHLLVPLAPGRYAFHDLLRLYAVERAEAEEPAGEREAALTRLYDWYQCHIDGGADLVYPSMIRLPRRTRRPPATFAGQAEAVAWLADEYRNAVAIVAYVADAGPGGVAWHITNGLRGYLAIRGHTSELGAAALAGRRAAARAADLPGQAAMELCLAAAATRQNRYQEATEHAVRMAALANEAGWPQAEAVAYGTLGTICWRSGQLSQGADVYRRALEILERIRETSGRATTQTNLTLILLDQGRPHEALRQATEALQGFQEAGELTGESNALSHLGTAYHLLGRWPEALAHLNGATARGRDTDNRLSQADALNALAAVRRDMGDLAEAERVAYAALDLAHQLGDNWHQANCRNTLASLYHRQGRHQEAVREHLRALELARRTDERSPAVIALAGLAAASRGLGDLETAWRYAEEALRLATECGYRVVEGQVRTTMAQICHDQGDAANAVRHGEQALAVHRECSYPLGQAEALRLLARAAPDAADRRAYHDELVALPLPAPPDQPSWSE
ncbi:hypothetical protein Psuf_060340 [Phytohabitans suffuscus]|uniref:NB-ARC domain-containing protein n=1 Tax=Phytohabitans suffuscus TaxID=624315 RepID=A0A6F8YSB4_9ACTN|nr:tetratricopeptide repeat protein [Phytohabitans suffuscus]BCB88721.1 hypothetical protein Psuf_060340 [Phytohabitans suffuscus]